MPARVKRAGGDGRTWTHIVVGGGTAGCVIAARLSERPELRVLLLEAGGWPLDPCLHVPLGLMGVSYRRHSWQYEVEPDESRAGTRELWPAGRALGGTSAINGMLWSRGARADYDAWAGLGLDGWGYDDVLRHFIAAERVVGGRPARGADGPVRVVTSGCREPLAREFLESAQAAGHAANPDYNDGSILGAAPLQIARGRRLRQSTGTAYLARARGRANLRIERRACASRIVIRDGRAVGVEYEQNGRVCHASCTSEIILCAGAIGSPAVLLRSGIGPAEHLIACRIPVVADIAGVGANLRNHPVMALVFEVSTATLNSQRSLPHLLAEAGRYVAGRGGLLTTAPSHVVVYGSGDGVNPDYCITFGSYGVTASGSGAGGRFARPMRGNAVTLRVQLFGSESRGTVRLRSAVPRDKPAIRYPALGGRRDVARMLAACRQARTIVQSPPLSRFVVRELTPGADVQSDGEWDAALRRVISAGRHYGGTCAMGEDGCSVVDASLRVRGLPNVRVADASVMPELPSSGLFAPTVMIAERAAELVAASGGAQPSSQAQPLGGPR
jgi:choline dehydrogenase